jgi:hypothetical protein
MEDRAGKQSSGTNGTSCTLDWPTPEMLRAARGAKAKALWDMASAFRRWLKWRAAQSVFAASRSPVGHR